MHYVYFLWLKLPSRWKNILLKPTMFSRIKCVVFFFKRLIHHYTNYICGHTHTELCTYILIIMNCLSEKFRMDFTRIMNLVGTRIIQIFLWKYFLRPISILFWAVSPNNFILKFFSFLFLIYLLFWLISNFDQIVVDPLHY